MKFSLYEPFTCNEAKQILSLDSGDYNLAISKGVLSASASLRDSIPCTERFHLGWDLLRYKLKVYTNNQIGMDLCGEELEELLDELEAFLERADDTLIAIGTEWSIRYAGAQEDPEQELISRGCYRSEYVPEPLRAFDNFLASCVDLCCRVIAETRAGRDNNLATMETSSGAMAESW